MWNGKTQNDHKKCVCDENDMWHENVTKCNEMSYFQHDENDDMQFLGTKTGILRTIRHI